MISVDGPISSPCVIPSWISGLPALPIAQMRPSRMPTSALTMPQWSRMMALVMTRSGAPFGARRLRLPLAVADDLAAAEDDLFAVACEVAFDLEDQTGVAEPDAIAGGRTVQVGVRRSGNSHRGRSRNPRVRARSSAASRCSSRDPSTRPLMPCDVAPATERDQVHFPAFAGLEAECRAGGDVEPAAIGAGAIEQQEPVHLEEVGVGSDLDRAVAGVVDAKADAGPPLVQLDRFGSQKVFAGNHQPLVRVESANRVVNGDELGAVGEGAFDLDFVDHLRDALHHIVAGQHRAPSDIRSATLLPSRMPSSTSAVMSAMASG